MSKSNRFESFVLRFRLISLWWNRNRNCNRTDKKNIERQQFEMKIKRRLFIYIFFLMRITTLFLMPFVCICF